jgi:hypothetical protein
MYKHRITIAWWLWLLMLMHASIFWGGVALTRDVGGIVEQSAQRENRLAYYYIWFGKQIDRQTMPMFAPAYADTHAGAAYPDILKQPGGAADRVVRAMGLVLQASHYGMPVMFVLALLMWWRRPKVIASLGGLGG